MHITLRFLEGEWDNNEIDMYSDNFNRYDTFQFVSSIRRTECVMSAKEWMKFVPCMA